MHEDSVSVRLRVFVCNLTLISESVYAFLHACKKLGY